MKNSLFSYSIGLIGAAFLFGSSGCSLADRALLDRLADAGSSMDGGGSDGGADPGASNSCGPGSDVPLITGTQENIVIDTRTLSNTVTALPGECNAQTPGRDGFLAVEVQAGEYWHFHLRVNREFEPMDPNPATKNPILYLLNSACVETGCRERTLANFCRGPQDEHFGIVFETTGTFYIGVDDGNDTGGVYLLDAIRPSCSDGSAEHGEACTGGNSCSDECRFVLSSANSSENGFNFNIFEANEVCFGGVDVGGVCRDLAIGSLDVSGAVGGFAGCDNPDVYTVNVPARGTLRVNTTLRPEDDCVPSSFLNLMLVDAAGNDQGGVQTVSDGNGGTCLQVDRTFNTAARSYLVVEDARSGADMALPYTLSFAVTPGT